MAASEVEIEDAVDEEEKSIPEMAPLYLFLASSLNVELVYIILASISKFSHLKNDGRTSSIDRS